MLDSTLAPHAAPNECASTIWDHTCFVWASSVQFRGTADACCAEELGGLLQRKFKTSCSITKLPGKVETGKEIALQGNLLQVPTHSGCNRKCYASVIALEACSFLSACMPSAGPTAEMYEGHCRSCPNS